MVIILLFLLIGVGSVTNASALGSSCPDCGDYEVPYPLSTNQDCGDSRYRIYCDNGSLEFLSATGTYYKILRIDPSANKLVINPPLILKDTCYSSDLSQGGFFLHETLPFNISTHNTVILLNCSGNILVSPLNCSSNSICRQFEEKVEEGSGCGGTLCCHYLKDSAMNSIGSESGLGGAQLTLVWWISRQVTLLILGIMVLSYNGCLLIELDACLFTVPCWQQPHCCLILVSTYNSDMRCF